MCGPNQSTPYLVVCLGGRRGEARNIYSRQHYNHRLRGENPTVQTERVDAVCTLYLVVNAYVDERSDSICQPANANVSFT